MSKQETAAAPPSTDEVEEWLTSIGARFIDVTFWRGAAVAFTERHVDDLGVLPDTVRMAVERVGHPATFPYMGRWGCAGMQRNTFYDTQAQAEMAAIHGKQ